MLGIDDVQMVVAEAIAADRHTLERALHGARGQADALFAPTVPG